MLFRPTGSAELEARKGDGEVLPAPPLPRGARKSPPPSLAGRGCFPADTPLQQPDSPRGTARQTLPFQLREEPGELASPRSGSRGRKPPVRPPQSVKSSRCLIVRQRHLKKRFSGRPPHRKLLGIILLLRREKKGGGWKREKGEGEEMAASKSAGEGSAQCGAGPRSSWQLTPLTAHSVSTRGDGDGAAGA